MLRSSLALLALVVGLTACGAAKEDRLNLKTPGAHTGEGPIVTLTPPTATATPKAAQKPKAKQKAKAKAAAVTADERRVIRAWSDELRHGHVARASRYFAVPSLVVNPTQSVLNTREAVKTFNAELPCGAKLLSTRRGAAGTVIATFRLTERPGGACGTGTGQLAAVGILVKRHHITRWLRRDDAVDPTAAAGGSGGGP
jgi:hypothetical protein